MDILWCENVEIPRISSLSKSDFDENYLLRGQPVVITDAIQDSPALSWTINNLYERVGDNVVHVRTNTDSEDYRLGRKYNIRQTTFREYADDLLKDNKRARNSYLAVQNLKKAFPQIAGDFEVPQYVEKIHGGPYLWVARPGHYEYCHFDPDDGLLVMLQGTKNVHLFSPGIDNMYPNVLGTKGRTVQSQVNCSKPDLDIHPKFAGTRCHHCELKPGDMLYIPAFWWHQVTSVEMAISINIFWGNGGKNNFLSKCMREPIWPSFRHWLLNLVEQNRECDSFQRTLSRFPEALSNFLHNQWHEEATEEQLQTLTDVVKEYLKIDTLPTELSCGKHPPAFQIRGLLWRS